MKTKKKLGGVLDREITKRYEVAIKRDAQRIHNDIEREIRQRGAEKMLIKANFFLRQILTDKKVKDFINRHRNKASIMVSYGHARTTDILTVLEISEDHEIDCTNGLFLAVVSKKILSPPIMEAKWKPMSKEELEKFNLPKGVTGKIEFGEMEENTDWLESFSDPFTPENCCLCFLERKHQQPFGYYMEKTDDLLPVHDILQSLTSEKFIAMIVKEAIPLEPEGGYPR